MFHDVLFWCICTPPSYEIVNSWLFAVSSPVSCSCSTARGQSSLGLRCFIMLCSMWSTSLQLSYNQGSPLRIEDGYVYVSGGVGQLQVCFWLSVLFSDLHNELCKLVGCNVAVSSVSVNRLPVWCKTWWCLFNHLFTNTTVLSSSDSPPLVSSGNLYSKPVHAGLAWNMSFVEKLSCIVWQLESLNTTCNW